MLLFSAPGFAHGIVAVMLVLFPAASRDLAVLALGRIGRRLLDLRRLLGVLMRGTGTAVTYAVRGFGGSRLRRNL